MRIVLLSGASSIHTIRWANGLSKCGHEVHVITQHIPIESFLPEVKLHCYPYKGLLGYFTMVPKVRQLMSKINPDIVNAHFASGYGLTARLVGFRPWLLSVWGSDIYDFPHKSPIHKWLIKRNLKSADLVASTSQAMAKETLLLAPDLEDICITPFGVDLGKFKDLQAKPIMKKKKLVIGTVKTMKSTYGIDILLMAFSLLLSSLQKVEKGIVPDVELRLVGGGEQTEELQALADKLEISNYVTFVGQVPHANVPDELSKLDIYVALSRIESFGVAVIEAGAAGLPVVVSNVGGLPEVTLEGETGFIVPKEDPDGAANAIEKLVLNAELRHRMGVAAKKHVYQNYSWDACINTMTDTYNKTILVSG